MFKRWFSALIIIALLITLFFVAFRTDFTTSSLLPAKAADDPDKAEAAKEEGPLTDDDTIVIWYTDDALSEYINDAALIYRKDTGRKVESRLVSGVEYLEHINSVSIADEPKEAMPDLYITTHDNLMKAYLAGLASVISDRSKTVIPGNYPSTALHAVSCADNYVAYPLYYETNFLLYNKTYMADIAKNRLKDESEALMEEEETGNTDKTDNASDENPADGDDEEEPEDDPMGNEDTETDPEVLERLSTMIPATIDDVLTFANNYDAPEAVEAVFKWDVSDIFYNYFFVGNYMEVGGEDGDNNAIFNLYNSQTVDCLKVYQDMNRYFSIDADDVSYDSILQEFIDGKLVFTVATTDAIARITDAKNKGQFDFEYGVTVLPDISSLLKARGLSVTSAIAVNGYSPKKEMANEFAAYLSFNEAEKLYSKAGKLPCLKNVNYDNPEMDNIMDEYEKSMPLPKMIETSNFWLQLEIAFRNVWKGADPDEVMRRLADTMGSQIEEITYSIPVQESIEAGAAGMFK